MFGRNKAAPTVEQMSVAVASQFGLDLKEVTDTFRGRDETLRSFFNQASSAKHDRMKYALESAGVGIVSVAFWPAAAGLIYTGYKTYDSHEKLKWVGNQIQAEIDRKNAAPAAAPAPGPTGN